MLCKTYTVTWCVLTAGYWVHLTLASCQLFRASLSDECTLKERQCICCWQLSGVDLC